MAERPGTVRRAGEVLATVLQRIDPDQQLRIFRIWTWWDDEVGAIIARRAQPAGFRNGILFVSVATHAWMQELQFMKETIRERLNARLGSVLVRDIYFVSGSVEEPAPKPPATEDHPALHGAASVALPPMTNPELAAAFARVLAARGRRINAARRQRSREGQR
jgi:hypothetical protein